jgi:hypothetical protein
LRVLIKFEIAKSFRVEIKKVFSAVEHKEAVEGNEVETVTAWGFALLDMSELFEALITFKLAVILKVFAVGCVGKSSVIHCSLVGQQVHDAV